MKLVRWAPSLLSGLADTWWNSSAIDDHQNAQPQLICKPECRCVQTKIFLHFSGKFQPISPYHHHSQGHCTSSSGTRLPIRPKPNAQGSFAKQSNGSLSTTMIACLIPWLCNLSRAININARSFLMQVAIWSVSIAHRASHKPFPALPACLTHWTS